MLAGVQRRHHQPAQQEANLRGQHDARHVCCEREPLGIKARKHQRDRQRRSEFQHQHQRGREADHHGGDDGEHAPRLLALPCLPVAREDGHQRRRERAPSHHEKQQIGQLERRAVGVREFVLPEAEGNHRVAQHAQQTAG